MDIENDITEEENQSNDLNRTEKIDFRLPAIMKNMVVETAKKQGVKISQFMTNLVQDYFAEQAKQDRIKKEREEQAQLKAQREYADFDKKQKHKKGDFSIDESDDKTELPKDWITILKNVSIWAFVAGIGYLIVTFFQNNTAKKERARYLQHWNTNQNQSYSKLNPIMSDKRSDKFVRH